METLLHESSVTNVKPSQFTTARIDPDVFLRWCRDEFKARFHKDVFFIVQNTERDARALANFLDDYLTTEIRHTLGGESQFFRELKSIMRTSSRKREIVDRRHIAMKLLNETNITLTQIGILCGGRDHSTVIHALHAFEDQYETNTAYRNMYDNLKQLCISQGFIFTPDAIKDYPESAVCSAEL